VRCLLDEPTRARVEATARAAFTALGLADYGRIDLRVTPAGDPFVIDVNPNCDLSDGAGYTRAASYGGFDYPAIIDRIAREAVARRCYG
jgi:D-alanine-D-alanine ligase